MTRIGGEVVDGSQCDEALEEIDSFLTNVVVRERIHRFSLSHEYLCTFKTTQHD